MEIKNVEAVPEKPKVDRAPLERRSERPHAAEQLRPVEFLSSFHNDIDPSAILSIERRPDDVVVMHCRNMYEYLKFGYKEDRGEIAKIEKYRTIFDQCSAPETVATGLKSIAELPEKEKREWLFDKLNAEGSAVSVEFLDGRKEAIVMMNDAPTRRMFNKDGTKRNEDELKKYDRNYRRTVEHEVRHVQFYAKYGKDLEERRKALESLRPLTPFDRRKYHYDRYTKDEAAAHIENEVIESSADGQITTQVNWEGIITNLQKKDYCREETFPEEADRREYLSVLTALVDRARTQYKQNPSPDRIMDVVYEIDVREFMVQS